MYYKIDLDEIFQRESERAEWKENVADCKNVVKTLTAFANDYSNIGGGYVVCGAKETKDELGYKKLVKTGLSANDLKKINSEVLNLCRTKVFPPITPLTEEIELKNGKRLLIFIMPASKKAHTFRTKENATIYYIRIGSQTREARNGLYMELMRKKREIEPWDTDIHSKADIKNIDTIIFDRYIKRMNILPSDKNALDFLNKEEAISEMAAPFVQKQALTDIFVPKNFSLLLFSKAPVKYFMGAYSVFSVYPGENKSRDAAERIEITDSIVEQAERLISYVNAENTTVFALHKDTPSNEKFPPLAVREAIVNAIVHRDYEIREPVRVTLFSDRLEIHSPGAIPVSLNKEDFEKGKAEVNWRNKSLAYYFNRLNLAEGVGRGFHIIMDVIKKNNYPAPVFKAGKESVTCIFKINPAVINIREKKRLQNISEESLELKKGISEYIEAMDSFTARDYKKAVYHAADAAIEFILNNNAQHAERAISFLITSCFDKINYKDLIKDRDAAQKIEKLYLALSVKTKFYEMRQKIRAWIRESGD
jgi:ATP-dependent DNA helicase RecG